MSYIEIYDKQLLDIVSLGKTIKDFNESRGYYIKIEVFKKESTTPLKTLYSNRLLLKYAQSDNYFLGDYHYHPENPEMGFCEGRKHFNNSISELKPIVIGMGADEILNKESKYKYQLLKIS